MKISRLPHVISLLVSATSLIGAELPVSPSQTPKGLGDSDWSGIREAYEHHRHAIVVNPDGTHQARNPGQAWVTRFDGRAFTVSPDDGSWSWGLELKSYGYPGHDLKIAGNPAVKAVGGRLEYRHDENLSEWFVNDSRGLEQGWTLQNRPPGFEAGTSLKLEIVLRGGLEAQVASGGTVVSFVDPGGANVIQYSNLKAWDADGKTVPVNFESGENGFRVVADDSVARYPITIDPIAQQANLKASNSANSDRFGCSVAVSGYTVIVGADQEDGLSTGVNGAQTTSSYDSNQGAAYVFVRSGTTWTQQAYLKASNSRDGFNFGNSVAISGDTIVVGAPREYWGEAGINGNQNLPTGGTTGAAYIFVRNGSTWVQQAFVKASNADGEDGFGSSVSISSNTVVIGAPGESGADTRVDGNQASNLAPRAGAAYVFVRDRDTWTQQAYLKASNARHRLGFGYSVAVSAHTIVVGSPYEDTNPTGVNGNQGDHPYEGTSYGAAYVFVRSGTTWSQQAYLKDSNNYSYALFGTSVALYGDTVVVGAPGEGNWVSGINSTSQDFTAGSSGAAFVFVRSGSAWSKQAYLKASNTEIQDYFGISVSIAGDTVVVGAQGEDSNATGVNGVQSNNLAPSSGAAYVFVRSVSTWSQQAYLKPSSNTDFRLFGSSVAISGGTAVLGAPYEFFPNLPEFPSPGATTIIDGLGSWFSLSTIAANGVAMGAGEYKTNGIASISATPNAGYVFTGWTGDATGPSNSFTVLMNGNKIVTANFVPDTLDPDGDGLSNYSEIVVQGTNPNVADSDGDGFNDGYEVQFSSNPKSAGSMPTFTLNLVNNGTATGGSFLKSGSLVHGTSATVTATPIPGYQFGSWTGGDSGSSTPLILLMDSNKSVGATFVQDTRDPDGDGLDNYNEIVVRATDPNVADTDGDGYSDGYEVGFSSNPKSSTSLPTFTLTLVNNGTATGGSFTKSGTLAHGTNATVTAAPSPGYLLGAWTNSATGSLNPLTLLMDSDKTVGATFVPDTRDPDGDGLDNYHEIVVHGSNPALADTDADGYLDGYEVQFASDPISATSVPKFSLTLVNKGMASGGRFAISSGNLAHATIATLTASPAPGQMLGKWTGDAAGNANPVKILMNSDKVVGATFVPDTRDPDGDGLDTYTEIVVVGSNPENADTDRDGVRDGVEVTDKTNPLLSDTDRDGLDDGLEKKLGTNPLRKDSDHNGIADTDEDRDRDGVSNGREVNELGTNPRKADSDGDGLTDGFELAFDGKTEAFTPRIGDRIRLDFKRFEFSGTMRMAGELPAGLRFDPVTQLLQGTLVGKPGSYSPRLQLFDGRSFVRSIPIPFRVAAFPRGLADAYEGLLETREGVASGLVAVTVSAPGDGPAAEAKWTATLDMPRIASVRAAAGPITLNPADDSVDLVISFPAEEGLEALVVSLRLDAASALVEGAHSNRDPRTSGTVRGFRLARGTRQPAVERDFTLIIDQGERDGFSIPAGLGWATGSLSSSGEISLAGQLGDSQSFTTSPRLSVTGQAIVWVKPYRNPNSWLGGIISFRESGLALSKSKKYQEPGLSWFRAQDASELSYPHGFGPLQAHAGIAAYAAPASAGTLAKSLGLAQRTFGQVLIEGGGLPDPKGPGVLPEAFVLRDNFALIAVPLKGRQPVPWDGAISGNDGTFAGTMKLPASSFGIVAGPARASGVLIRGAGFEGIMAAGLVVIPVNDGKGAFRTAAIMISK